MVDLDAGSFAAAIGTLLPHAAAMTATRAKAEILILCTIRNRSVTWCNLGEGFDLGVLTPAA
jgi:hypothetical protein